MRRPLQTMCLHSLSEKDKWPMLELYGYPVSNFYNKVKLALLEKNIKFVEKRSAPSRKEPGLLKKVPTGRIPYLKQEDFVLFESGVILEYLEEAFPDTLPLLPKDPKERAYVRMIANLVDLHIDPPARRLYGLLRGEEVSDVVKAEALPDLKFGIDALKRMTSFSPFIAGENFSIADCAALATLPLADEIYAFLEIESELQKLADYPNYLERMQKRLSVKKVFRGAKAARRGLKMAQGFADKI